MCRALAGNQKNRIQLSISHLTTGGLFHSPCSLVLQVKIGLFFLTEASLNASDDVGAQTGVIGDMRWGCPLECE